MTSAHDEALALALHTLYGKDCGPGHMGEHRLEAVAVTRLSAAFRSWRLAVPEARPRTARPTLPPTDTLPEEGTE